MEDNYYKFSYKLGDTEVEYTCSADKTIWELADELRNFLRGCSWLDSTIDKVLITEDN